eukprot:TRINITY_DN19580_c0_g1_i1.p1 TRINITY_DN19580_c0_g1~~TRINITY_DN19580_c0_g1_i1.p1  ORF type:complete len:350 (+),score=41.17 TRINITY_DN19580_c0_g1_i1:324-1373(+)
MTERMRGPPSLSRGFVYAEENRHPSYFADLLSPRKGGGKLSGLSSPRSLSFYGGGEPPCSGRPNRPPLLPVLEQWDQQRSILDDHYFQQSSITPSSSSSMTGVFTGSPNTQQHQGSPPSGDKRFKSLPPTETLPRSEPLGGYVFVCNNETMEENLKRQLFGLPQRYRDSVRAIQPGLPLFLYNYTTHQLHGVFEATSFGGSNIDPTAWEDKKSPGESRFPAQVRTRVRKRFRAPLDESHFRPILHHYDGPKFRLQLSIPETLQLLDLFEEREGPQTPPLQESPQSPPRSSHASMHGAGPRTPEQRHPLPPVSPGVFLGPHHRVAQQDRFLSPSSSSPQHSPYLNLSFPG